MSTCWLMGYRHEHSPSVIATVFVTIMIGFLKFPDDKVKKLKHIWNTDITCMGDYY